MPPEEMWRGFFDPAECLRRLGLSAKHRTVVDFGCGYGTFSLLAARLCGGMVHAIDIDAEMINATRLHAEQLGLTNLQCLQRDFVEEGSGLADGSADFVMLFNILHAAEAGVLLAEARRVLRDGGVLAVVHWNYDPTTPRGPSMEIRLRPEQCVAMVANAGFRTGESITLPPYHYGFAAYKI